LKTGGEQITVIQIISMEHPVHVKAKEFLIKSYVRTVRQISVTEIIFGSRNVT